MSLAACAAVPVRDVMKPILIGLCCAHTNPGLRTMARTSTMTRRTGTLFARALMMSVPPFPRSLSKYRGASRLCRGASRAPGGLGGPSRPPMSLDDSVGDLAYPPAHEGAPVGHEAGDHEL